MWTQYSGQGRQGVTNSLEVREAWVHHTHNRRHTCTQCLQEYTCHHTHKWLGMHRRERTHERTHGHTHMYARKDTPIYTHTHAEEASHGTRKEWPNSVKVMWGTEVGVLGKPVTTIPYLNKHWRTVRVCSKLSSRDRSIFIFLWASDSREEITSTLMAKLLTNLIA